MWRSNCPPDLGKKPSFRKALRVGFPTDPTNHPQLVMSVSVPPVGTIYCILGDGDGRSSQSSESEKWSTQQQFNMFLVYGTVGSLLIYPCGSNNVINHPWLWMVHIPTIYGFCCELGDDLLLFYHVLPTFVVQSFQLTSSFTPKKATPQASPRHLQMSRTLLRCAEHASHGTARHSGWRIGWEVD